jgi:hypothetical protein
MSIPATRLIYDRPKAIPPENVARYVLLIKLMAFVSIVSSPLWLAALFFTSPQDYSSTSSLICVPILAIVAAVAAVHFTQSDPYLRRLLLTGLIAHMAASSVFLWVGFFAYGGTVDAFHYWTMGLQLTERFQIVGWNAFHGPYWSTNLIENICGFTTLLVGDALPTLFIAFSLISLAGTYLYYRAFTVSFPDGDRWLFGLLVVLLPSLLFWSSSVGKDSLIQYFIALTCYGFARITRRPGPAGVLYCAAGLVGALLIRAHVASMLAIAVTFPYTVARLKPGGANRAVRIVLIPVLVAGTYLLISEARNLLDISGDNSTGVLQEADAVTRTSQIGGSAFNEGTSLAGRIAASPFLLFRPFPWEIHSAMGVAPALESVGWIYLCWVRRRQIWSTLQHWRDPYAGFLLMYSVVFLITFAGSISNFGILLRQRIMMVPVALMLICARQKSPLRSALRKLTRNAWLSLPAGMSRTDHIPAGP